MRVYLINYRTAAELEAECFADGGLDDFAAPQVAAVSLALPDARHPAFAACLEEYAYLIDDPCGPSKDEAPELEWALVERSAADTVGSREAWVWHLRYAGKTDVLDPLAVLVVQAIETD